MLFESFINKLTEEYPLIYRHCKARIDIYEVKGEDRIKFLNNMVTADIKSMKVGESKLGCFLTQKGKILAWFTIHLNQNSVFVLFENQDPEPIVSELQKYVIAQQVSFEKIESENIQILFSFRDKSFETLLTKDPIEIEVETGRYIYLLEDSPHMESKDIQESSKELFELFQMINNIPKYSEDISEQNFPLENSFLVNAISHEKGCYRGQETIARLHSRGNNVSRKFFPFVSDSPVENFELNQPEGGGIKVYRLSDYFGKTFGIASIHRNVFKSAQSASIEGKQNANVQIFWPKEELETQ